MKPSRLLLDLSNWRTLMMLSALLAVAISCSYYVQIFPYTDIQAFVLFPVSFFFASLLIYNDNVLKHKDMWLLLAAFLWTIVSFLANAYRLERALQTDEFISICVTLFIIYPLAGALDPKRRKYAFRFLAAVNVFLIACLCIFTLYCVILDVKPFFPTLNGTTIRIDSDQRLHLFSTPNGGAIFCQVAASLCVYLMLSTKNRLLLILEGIGFAAIYCVLALMESRTSSIAFSVALAMLAYLCIVRAQWKTGKIFHMILAFVCSGIVIIACMYGFKGVRSGMNAVCAWVQTKETAPVAELSDHSVSQAVTGNRSAMTAVRLQAISEDIEPIETTPAASEDDEGTNIAGNDSKQQTEQQIFSGRKFFDDDAFTLNGRTNIWKAVLTALPQRTCVLLFGTSPRFANDEFNGVYPPNHATSLHNSFLCILVSYGVIGLLIWSAFLLNLFVCGARVFFSKPDKVDLPTAFLMSLLVTAFITSMMESMLFNSITPLSLQTWMMLAGGYAVALNREWKQSASNDIPIRIANQ